MPRSLDIDALAAGVAQRAPRPLARAISLTESGHPDARAVLAALPAGREAHIVGLTGPPGVGKSTTTSALVTTLRAAGRTVAVLAVDPSSPFTGGALLGDRVRMGEHATDSGVFIRSMAARGHLGGLAAAVPQAVRLLEAAGFDLVLIETVGVGQSEVEIARRADTCVVLLAPGLGDGIQAAKAGILEIADIFGVNKADREGSEHTVSDLRTGIRLTARPTGAWRPTVISLSAQTGQGIAELLAAIEEHRAHAQRTGTWQRRRAERAAAEVEALVLAAITGKVHHQVAARLATGDGAASDPHTLAEQILTHW
ncbi:MAG: methylmalonyl Co-A mutase-associated GTPase MeaB [Actinobacteria bacterium]|uniref:Methylmalonyl Co-A mutase-associated GTPase MeaB n=1 Tax=Nostocoides veronense TaxID=330836 RepID=A0ABP4XY09_9MICO|nr:methylmalonyl Co-A mutase-associated GTPase MeaB [Actinomycetota bacterium]